MMVEREEMKDFLLRPGVLKFRRAIFLIRHLIPVEYSTLEGNKKVRFVVSPMNFLYLVFDGRAHAISNERSYDHYRVLDEKKKITKELGKFRFSYSDEPKEVASNSGLPIDFSDGNLLQIKLDSAGIDLFKFGVKSKEQGINYKKLIFSVQVHKKTEVKEVYKKTFGEGLLIMNDKVLQDEVISIPNV